MKTAELFTENGVPYTSGNNGSDIYTDEESIFPVTMPIAIIGMSCRFPGDAINPEKLWEFCANAKSAWSEIPKSRFNQEAWYHPSKENPGTVSMWPILYHICRLTLMLLVICEGGTFSSGGYRIIRCIVFQLFVGGS